MKKLTILATAVATLSSASAFAQQAEGNFMMRVRAVNIDTANKSTAIPGVLPADAIEVSNKVIPEVDFTYFFSKNLAAELILTIPQKHDVKVPALNKTVGTFKHLPPTLTVQYHFFPDAQFRPYVGAGINFTSIMSVDLKTLDGVTRGLTTPANTATNGLDNHSWGGALQAGFDVKIGPNSFINFDVKKVYIKTDLTNSALGKLSTVKVDPVLIGVGYGFKF